MHIPVGRKSSDDKLYVGSVGNREWQERTQNTRYEFTVRMDKIKGPVKAWWYNPRTGQATAIGEFPNTGTLDFTPADEGENVDWVLVLDDAGAEFQPPGAMK